MGLKQQELEPREYLVLDDRELVYLVLSKAACTAIKNTIAKSYSACPPVHMAIHGSTFNRQRQIFGELNQKQKTYFAFTFVRNPFERLVSCYRDKIIYTPSHYNTPDEYFKNYYKYYNKYPLDTGISFEAFVSLIAHIPDSLSDRHFKSQASVIFDENGVQQVDFIGKLETVNEDWTYIAKRFGFETVLAKQNTTDTKKHALAHRDYRNYYTPALAEQVYHRYQKDVELLGYEETFETLVKLVSTPGTNK